MLTTAIRRGPHIAVPGGEKTAAGLASLVAAVAYMGIAALHGAIGVPRNDDWTYLRSAYRLASDGIFTPGTSTAMLVGQTVLAWPVVRVFGPEVAPLQVLVALVGSLGLWAAYLAVRRVLPPSWSAFSVGCLALGPVFGSLDSSFMTDVPAFSLQMLALLAGLHALRSRDLAINWFAASLLAGIAAFSIREYAVAAPVAVIAAAFLRTRPKRLRPGWKVVGLTVLWLAVLAALFIWRRGLSGSLPESFLGSSRLVIAPLFSAGFTLALFVTPLLPLVSIPRLVASLRASRGIAIVLGLGVSTTWAVFVCHRSLFLGNYVTETGAYSVTIPGTAPVVIPPGLWTVLEVLSLASLLMLAFLGLVGASGLLRSRTATKPGLVASPGNGQTVMLLFCVTTIGVLQAAKLLMNTPLFDRNLVPIIPFVVALAVRVALDHGLVVRRTGLVVTLALVVFGSLGIGMVDTTATFDGAKWQLARSVEAQGYEAGSIDGGYEWFSYHQTGPIVQRPVVPGTNFWLSQFAERPVCVTSQFEGSPPTGHLGAGVTVVSTVSARSLLGVDYHLIAVSGPASCRPGE